MPLPTAAPPTATPLGGEVASPTDIPPGCAFHPRCPARIEGLCAEQRPTLRDQGDGHRVARHLHD